MLLSLKKSQRLMKNTTCHTFTANFSFLRMMLQLSNTYVKDRVTKVYCKGLDSGLINFSHFIVNQVLRNRENL